jgi:hypothetical protein
LGLLIEPLGDRASRGIALPLTLLIQIGLQHQRDRIETRPAGNRYQVCQAYAFATALDAALVVPFTRAREARVKPIPS